MEPVPDRELSSWKEIAAYLRVGVRSAQMWERDRGLPVRRLPGGRGRVAITVGEIEAWKHSADAAPAPAPPTRPWNRFVFAAVILLAVGTGIASIVGLPRHRPPAAFRIEQNQLIVTDAGHRELWRKLLDLPAPITSTDKNAWFGDLDGDGRTEMLLVVASGQPGAESDLICYSDEGRERWRFVPGRTVHTPGETFKPPFRAQHFAVARFGRERALRIVATSQHYLYYPSQIVLLSPNGEVLREYWHSGGFGHMLVTDLDGAPEILLAGVDNARKSATLVVLDPDTMAGASVEDNPDYQLQGFSPGQERSRLLFPRSCLNRLLEPFAYVESLWTEPGEIGLEVCHQMGPRAASLYYHLNRDLSLRTMSVSGSFEHAHKEFSATGALRHPFDGKEEAELRNIEYRRRMF